MRRFLQLLMRFLVYPSIWVAAAIALLVFFVQSTLALPFSWQPAALIFCAALLPYNLDRVLDTFVQKDPNRKGESFFKSSAVVLILLAAAVSTGVLIHRASLPVRWVSLGGFVPLIYGLPLFPWRSSAGPLRWYRIKDIPGGLAGAALTYAKRYRSHTPSSIPISLVWLLIFVGSTLIYLCPRYRI